MTRKDVLEEIRKAELNGEFDKHVDPVSYETAIPVNENFHYLRKGFFERIKYRFCHIFIVRPYTFYQNKFKQKTKVEGKKNLKGLKKAILTCNHVNKMDCLVVKGSVKHKIKITAADFNNQQGFFGEMMRIGGMIPFGDYKALKNMNHAMDIYLKKNYYILFYPEQAMWWNYEKPRPFKNGAFHYAMKYDVPVVPCFITFKERNKVDKEGIPLKQFTLHIMPPIYKKEDLSEKENIEYLKNADFEACKNKYESVYNKKLKYTTKQPIEK